MSSDNRTVLQRAPIWRALVHLCIPMIAGLAVGVVYNVINAGFIGALHSTPLLAALTFSMPAFGLVMAVGGVFGVGGSTLASRLLGALDEPGADQEAGRRRIRQASSFTAWGAIVGGVVIGIAGLVFATPLAAAVGASGEALAPTAQYLGAMAAFAPALVGGFALEQLVRAEGAARVSMYGLIASAVANLLFDMLFILVLGWGVLGAGIALGLSNVVIIAYYAWWLIRRSTAMSLDPRDLRVDRDLLRSVFGVGVSELLMSSFLIVSSLVMNWVAVAYGDALLAAMGLAQRIAQLPEMITMGIGMGAIPLFAYAFGARDGARLRGAVRASAIAIVTVTVVFTTVVFLFRDQILTMFTTDPAVLADGGLVLTAMLVSTVFNGTTVLVISVFQATEQIRNGMIMSVAQGVLFVPVILLANAWFGLPGVAWSMTATEVVVFALGIALLAGARSALCPDGEAGALPAVEGDPEADAAPPEASAPAVSAS